MLEESGQVYFSCTRIPGSLLFFLFIERDWTTLLACLLASIQPRTSPVKFARSPRTDPTLLLLLQIPQVCETISVTGPRFLNDEWGKEDESMEHFNPYQQTYEAFKVLADSYGQNGLIDIVNLRYLLTSCGEEMSDEEFDEALREIGQSSLGWK